MLKRNAVKHAACMGERIRRVRLTFAAATVIEAPGSQPASGCGAKKLLAS